MLAAMGGEEKGNMMARLATMPTVKQATMGFMPFWAAMRAVVGTSREMTVAGLAH